MTRVLACQNITHSQIKHALIRVLRTAMTSRAKGRYYCDHCRDKVSKTLYYAHKKLYYDATSKQWKSGTSATSTSCSSSRVYEQDIQSHVHDDFIFSDSSSPELGESFSHYNHFYTRLHRGLQMTTCITMMMRRQPHVIQVLKFTRIMR